MPNSFGAYVQPCALRARVGRVRSDIARQVGQVSMAKRKLLDVLLLCPFSPGNVCSGRDTSLPLIFFFSTVATHLRVPRLTAASEETETLSARHHHSIRRHAQDSGWMSRQFFRSRNTTSLKDLAELVIAIALREQCWQNAAA